MSSIEWTTAHTLLFGVCLIVFGQSISSLIVTIWSWIHRPSLERFDAYLRRRQ